MTGLEASPSPREERSRFAQHTHRLGIKVDVSLVADALESLRNVAMLITEAPTRERSWSVWVTAPSRSPWTPWAMFLNLEAALTDALDEVYRTAKPADPTEIRTIDD